MASHGRKAVLLIGPEATDAEPPAIDSEFVEVKLLQDGTFNRAKGEIETTTRGSGIDDEFIPGHRNGTYDATGLYAPDDAGIEAILDNYDADEQRVWFCDRPKGEGAGLPEHVFQGFVTNAPTSVPLKGVSTMQITIRVSGKVTRRTQSA